MRAVDLYKNFTRFKKRLQRMGYLGEYALTVEAQNRGALHLHCLLFDSERGGGFIPAKALENAVIGSGFGKIHKIVAVEPSGLKPQNHLAEYLLSEATVISQAKDMTQKVAQYCTNGNALALQEKSDYRLRPFRSSRNLSSGGIRHAEDALADFWFPTRDKTAEFEVWKAWEVSDRIDRLDRMRRATADLEIKRQQRIGTLEEAADRLLLAA
jgi:hypothetical protein